MANKRNGTGTSSIQGSRGHLLVSAASGLVAVSLAMPAMAQDQTMREAGPSVFEEIVVTARKREESLYATPISITAFSEEGLTARNAATLSDVGNYVPNLNITRFGVGNPAHAAIFIRGIGLQDHIITTDPGVGVYVDGVYLGRQMGANLNLNNVERVEVLRGPQGTFYGRNTIGGAVNIITKKPGAEEVFRFNLTGGTRARVAGDFYGNFNLSDRVGVSVSGAVDRRDGIGRALNIVEPVRKVGELFEASGRLAINWDVSDRFSLLATADVVQGENGQSPSYAQIIPGLDAPGVFAATGNGFFTDPIGPATGLPGGPLKSSDFAANLDDTNTSVGSLLAQSNSGFGTSLTAGYVINDNLSTKLLTSYRQSSYTGGLDDETAFQDFQSFPERGEADQFSVEAQLNGEYDALDFVGGLYYFREEGNTFSGPNTFISHGDTFDINQTTNSYAIYAHGGYQVSDDFKLGGGLRYTRDEKDADALFTNFPWFLPAPAGNGNGTPGSAQRVFRSDSWDAVTWDVNATYDIADTLNAFATISRGYQNGGYPARPFGGPDTFASFNPTFALNYETGLKGTIADVLQLYLSAFYTRYKDLALQFSAPSEAGFITITANAGRSRALGVELEGTVHVTDAFSLQSSIGYIDAEVTSVLPGTVGVAEGDTPSLTPKWTLAIAPQYTVDLANGGTLVLRADYSYRSAMFGQSVNNPFNRLAARDLVGFNIKYEAPGGDWALALYGKNIFNEKYDVGRLDQFFSGFVEVIRSNDRSEFGLRFTKRFG
ncbi:MAG: TonB-dependent receptor [Pseudomonadota bacterium]